MSIGVRGVDRHLTQELLQVTLVGRVLSSVTRQRRRRKNTLGRDSCMFHVTMRTLRNVGCRGCAVGEELFPSCEDGCAETGPWGRRACKRVNSAVNEGNGVSRNRCGRKTQKARLVARVPPLMAMVAAVLSDSWRRMDGVEGE
jgi:hypothetical protein